jgi:hypothetical protein
VVEKLAEEAKKQKEMDKQKLTEKPNIKTPLPGICKKEDSEKDDNLVTVSHFPSNIRDTRTMMRASEIGEERRT